MQDILVSKSFFFFFNISSFHFQRIVIYNNYLIHKLNTINLIYLNKKIRKNCRNVFEMKKEFETLSTVTHILASSYYERSLRSKLLDGSLACQAGPS